MNKNRLTLLRMLFSFIAITLLFTSISCKKKESAPQSVSNGVYLRCTVDGENWNDLNPYAKMDNGGILIVTVKNSNYHSPYMNIFIPGNTTGSYDLTQIAGFSSTSNYGIVDSLDMSAGFRSLESGDLIINNITTTAITGTFNSIVWKDGINSIHAINGSFSILLK